MRSSCVQENASLMLGVRGQNMQTGWRPKKQRSQITTGSSQGMDFKINEINERATPPTQLQPRSSWAAAVEEHACHCCQQQKTTSATPVRQEQEMEATVFTQIDRRGCKRSPGLLSLGLDRVFGNVESRIHCVLYQQFRLLIVV